MSYLPVRMKAYGDENRQARETIMTDHQKHRKPAWETGPHTTGYLPRAGSTHPESIGAPGRKEACIR